MVPTLKAEFKKLLTIRSTYGWILLAVVIVGIFSFYGEGFKDAAQITQHPKLAEQGTLFIAGTITQMANFISLFAGIIALLLITHEYRYNTITYTLTASNSRTRVLASKIMAVLGFVFVYSLLATLYGIGMIFLGLAFSHNALPHQDINYLTYVGKALFNAEGFALVALVFGALIRNQVGSLAALFIIPGSVEALLSLLLKNNAIYLPFTALSQVIQAPTIAGAKPEHPNPNITASLSPAKGAVVFLIYLVIAWAIAWYLFLRRDATKLD